MAPKVNRQISTSTTFKSYFVYFHTFSYKIQIPTIWAVCAETRNVTNAKSQKTHPYRKTKDSLETNICINKGV